MGKAYVCPCDRFGRGEHTVSILGNRVVRTEDPKLLTVGGDFVDGLGLEGALWVTYVRSPIAHARIVAIDTAPAGDGQPDVLGDIGHPQLTGRADTEQRRYNAGNRLTEIEAARAVDEYLTQSLWDRLIVAIDANRCPPCGNAAAVVTSAEPRHGHACCCPASAPGSAVIMMKGSSHDWKLTTIKR